MKNIKIFLVLLLSLMLPLLHSDEKAEKNITGFTIMQISNKSAKIKVGDGKYTILELNKFYAFPCTLRSNRAQVVLQFSEKNTAKLLPNTTLKLHSPKVKHPKLKLLSGKITVQLDKFPKDHKMEVTTPTAVCGAVGTHFEVNYEHKNTEQGIVNRAQSQSFKCTKGEIYVASNSFRIGGVKAGDQIDAESHKGKSNAYCQVNMKPKEKGNSFKLELPGKTKLVCDRQGSFELAHPTDKAMAVVRFRKGNFQEEGMIYNSKVDATEGKSYIKVGGKLIEHADTDAYMTAAKNEGRLQTRIQEIDEQLELEADVTIVATLQQEKKALEPQRDKAEKAANTIAKRFEQNQNIRRMIMKIRQNLQRQNRRKMRH